MNTNELDMPQIGNSQKRERNIALTVFYRILEIVVIIACFWFIKYLVVEYINPLPEMAKQDKSYEYFGRAGDEQQQQFDIFFFCFLFFFIIACYYCLLYAAKHKKKGHRKKDAEQIKEYRKVVFGRSGFVIFLHIPAFVISVLFGGSIGGTAGESIGAIAPMFIAISFAPWFIFRGVSKGISLAFCLKFTAIIVVIFILMILFFSHTPRYLIYIIGSLPVGVEYEMRINRAWNLIGHS